MPPSLERVEQSAEELAQSSGLLVIDSSLQILHASGNALRWDDGEPQTLVGASLAEVLPDRVWSELGPRAHRALAGEPAAFGYLSPSGERAYCIQLTPIRDAAGAVGSIVVVATELTRHLSTLLGLERSDARLRAAEQMIGTGSWELEFGTGAITYSDGTARVIGIDPEGTLSFEEYMSMVFEDDRGTVAAAIERCLRDGSASAEYRIVRRDGAVRTVALSGEVVRWPDGAPRYLRGAVLDVTEERESEQQRLAAMALFRHGFDAAPIGMALTDPQTGRYTQVNDALCALLGRPREELLKLSVSEVTHPEDVARDVAARAAMLSGEANDYQTEKRYLRADGAAVWAAIHIAPVRAADGSVEAFFAQKIDITERKEREAQLSYCVTDAQWLGRIRDALDNDRMVLYWQPVVDLRTRKTVQRELLLRMRDEDGNIIPPGVFLPIAERYGVIAEIDRWVVRRAAEIATDGVPTAFNLSAASMGDPGVIRVLESAIATTGIDPSLLVIEVTETSMIDRPGAGRDFAEQVRALGCELALDDFGAGFAGFGYLKHLDVAELKIDIDFVRDIATNETSLRLVRGIVGLAREFEHMTVAEGIEDEQTLAKLLELGVERGQGYLFARPAPIDTAPRVRTPVRARRRHPAKDPIATVKSAFRILSERDLEAARHVCDPDIVLRPIATAERAGREASYRGYEGLRQYYQDLQAVWQGLEIVPDTFWESDGAVIAAGGAIVRNGADAATMQTLWVFRFCGERIATVDVFRRPDEAKPPVHHAALTQALG